MKEKEFIREFLKRNNLSKIEEETITRQSRQELSANRYNSYNELLASFVEHYGKKSRQIRGMKIAYFAIAFSILLILLGIMFTVCIVIMRNGHFGVNEVIALISAFTAIVSSILVLPKIIGKHLFPDAEDREILDFLKSLIEK